jgi:hypothetical protein
MRINKSRILISTAMGENKKVKNNAFFIIKPYSEEDTF